MCPETTFEAPQTKERGARHQQHLPGSPINPPLQQRFSWSIAHPSTTGKRLLAHGARHRQHLPGSAIKPPLQQRRSWCTAHASTTGNRLLAHGTRHQQLLPGRAIKPSMILSLLSRLLMLSSPTARAIIVRTAIWLVYACKPCMGEGSRNQNLSMLSAALMLCPMHRPSTRAYSMNM